MKERPIIFSGSMVRAILEDRKTQTRRVIKPQPTGELAGIAGVKVGFLKYEPRYIWRDERSELTKWLHCSHGDPGDRLWVRETWAVSRRLDPLPPRKFSFLQDNPDFPQSIIYYHADSSNGINPLRGKWRPSIHMPRWASRITLEVTGVRAERIQDISMHDALSEGAEPLHSDFHDGSHCIGWFKRIWDSINAKRGFGWDANNWVWVIEFKKIKT